MYLLNIPSIYYIGKFEGGFAILDSMRLKLGVSETIPGKWKIVANSSDENTKTFGFPEVKNDVKKLG